MDTDKCTSPTEIEINDEIIENVSHFEYLGSRFVGDGSSKQEIRRRLAIAKQKLSSLEKLWKGEDNHTKLRILKSCIFPIALYGCEAWTLLQSDLNRILAFEMRCYRKILRVSWTERVTNERVRKRLNISSSHLLMQIKKQKLSYFGHIKRHQSLERTILEGRVEGKRKRGRPRRQWEDDIRDWLQMSVEKAGRLAQDRPTFRGCVWAATTQGTAFAQDVPRVSL